MPDVRPAAVAGMFYPGAPPALAAEVRAHLAGARSRGAAGARRAQGADRAARRLRLFRPDRGLGLRAARRRARRRSGASCCSARRTACRSAASRCRRRGRSRRRSGTVAVDREAVAAALTLPQVVRERRGARARALARSAAAVPAGGARRLSASCRSPSATRRRARWPRCSSCSGAAPETLIVVSSDLSHYLALRRGAARSTARPRERDPRAFAPTLDHEQACGATPINGLLLAARRRGLQPELLDLRNSGDTAGDKAARRRLRVVRLLRRHARQRDRWPTAMLGRALLTIARAAIGAAARLARRSRATSHACAARSPARRSSR